jgi:hypothetical protein
MTKVKIKRLKSKKKQSNEKDKIIENIKPFIRQKKQFSKLRTVKTSLESVIIDDNIGTNKDIIMDAVNRTHQTVIHVYQFIRLYILKKYHDKQEIPVIDTNFISMVFKALTVNSIAGPTPKGSNLKRFNEFKKFYMTDYKKLGYRNKINGVNLSQIFNYMKIDILTNIENNIKMHFMSYVKRFVNSSFREKNNTLLERAVKGTKTALRKELSKDLYEIGQDLINNTLDSNIKYHKWINKHRKNIFPKEFKDSYEFDIKHNPQKYMKCMIYMCIELEKINSKSFQFFPIRSNIAPKYIPIDTATLIDLFIAENKNKYFGDIDGYKNELWNTILDTNNSIFKQKNYSFDYRIVTDGFAISLQLIENSMIELEKIKKDNKKKAKLYAENLYKTLSQKKIEKIKANNEVKKKQLKIADQLARKKERDLKKELFKKLSKEDQLKQRSKEKDERDRKKKETYIEFPYLEDLNETEYDNLKKSDNWVVCDPGKRDLLYMKNKNGVQLRYSNKQHLKKTKRFKYQTLIQNYRNKNGISEIEKQLTTFNSKSCIYKNFQMYIKQKNKINSKLLKKYENNIFRKYKWYGFINRKKAETDLIRNIKKKFGKDVTIIYGDWSIGRQMSNFISTPNLGLKRKLGEYLKIYNIDEFRTSCLNSKTLTRCENMYLPDKKGVIRKKHSILTYEMENKRKGCINRDNNAVNNMINITKQFIEHKTRPIHFTRGVKLEDIKISVKYPIVKDNNLEIKFNKIIRIY